MISKQQIIEKGQADEYMMERMMLENLCHPFLMRALGTFEDTANVYFVMPVYKGGELFQCLRTERIFSESRVKFYLSQIVLALEHMHDRNIIYRDLKLENILLDTDGYVCLTDFGLAKHVASTNKRGLCGTPEYLSPESILGNGSSKASDWWSLGILMYEMLQRLPPFYDKQQKVMFEKIVHKDLDFSTTLLMSDAAKDLLTKLLQKNPKQRLGSHNGAREIKDHPWFSDVDWTQLPNKPAHCEFKPVFDDHRWLDYIDSSFVQRPIDSFYLKIYGEDMINRP